MNCFECKTQVKPEEVLKCNACSNTHHYHCIGLLEVDFKKILPMNKGKWKCPSCKQRKTQDKLNSPIVLNKVNEPMSSIVNLDGNSIIVLMNKNFDTVKLMIEDLRADINNKWSKISETVATWESNFIQMESTVAALVTANEKLSSENDTLRNDVQSLKSHVEELEQRSRNANIEIQNVPERKGENLMHVIESIGAVIGYPIPPTQVKDVHRVAHNAKSDRPKNIIVQLATRHVRNDVLAAARVRRGLTVAQLQKAMGGTPTSGLAASESRAHDQNIYIKEHLTLKNKILYAEARKAKKEKNYKFVWIKNATILMRKTDDSRVVTIRNSEDLLKL